MAHQNMTTLCENYACTFHEAGGGSQNHIMLGGWDAWLLSSVGGLDSAVNGSTGGCKDIIARVSPGVVAELKTASYTKKTTFGDVTLTWEYADGKLGMELTLPVGTTATVHTPQLVGGKRLQMVHETSSGAGEDLMASRETPEGVRAVEVTAEAVLTTVVGGLGRGGPRSSLSFCVLSTFPLSPVLFGSCLLVFLGRLLPLRIGLRLSSQSVYAKVTPKPPIPNWSRACHLLEECIS